MLERAGGVILKGCGTAEGVLIRESATACSRP